MKRLLVAGVAALAVTVGTPVGVSTANAATTRSACVTNIWFSVLGGNAGNISEYETCGHGRFTFRARAECFRDNGRGGGIWRNGSWRTRNRKKSIAGCKTGTYIDNGGYQVHGHHRYHVLWRNPGHPL